MGVESLKCFYTNATSLKNKFNELEALAYNNDYDVIFVAETWFDENALDAWNLAQYTCYRRDRVGDPHGGVCIYVKNRIKSFDQVDSVLTCRSIEQVWCSIDFNLPNIVWPSFGDWALKSHSANDQIFVDTIDNCFLLQFVLSNAQNIFQRTFQRTKQILGKLQIRWAASLRSRQSECTTYRAGHLWARRAEDIYVSNGISTLARPQDHNL
jgi:hypothetical protein